MSQLDEDLSRLVREDPLPTSAADSAGLIRVGTRLRRRRRLAVTAGVGLAAAAVIAPFALLGGGSDAVDLSPAEQPRATTKAPAAGFTPGICGVAVCNVKWGGYGSPEEGELMGKRLFAVGRGGLLIQG